MKKYIFTIFFTAFFSLFAHGTPIKIGSLPNPNVVVAFVMKEKNYAEMQFVPVMGDVSTMVGLMKSGKVDAVFVNYEAAQKLAKDLNWVYAGSSISKAVHIITTEPIKDKTDLERFNIVGSFRGGSPDILFRKLNIKKEPLFTDLNIAVQLFLKGEYNAIFLPEPHVSNVILKMKKLNKNYYVYDILSLYNTPYRYPINALLVKDLETQKILVEATKKVVEFIENNPEETVKIFNNNFKNYFNMEFPSAALEEAIKNKRLKFEYFEHKE
jgi:ABC-type nitrate/sulfonate/bicarbonate transport system substrate-binding protein